MAKILIIDDDPANRDILKVRLEIAGHQVLEATNGEEALPLSASSHPDLIFLDVMMPKLDGWQVCRLLKADPKTKDIPVVMLTACFQEIDQLRGYESGADEYLAKPWDPNQISTVLEKLLKGDTV